MSKSFLRLADFILDSYISSALMTATEIAHEVNIDAATVVRFAQTLGYSGFPELHKEIKARVKKEFTVKTVETRESVSTDLLIKEFAEYLVNIFSKTNQFIYADQIDNICKTISKASNIIFILEPDFQSLITKLETILTLSGKTCSRVNGNPEELAGKIQNIRKDDMVICIDVIRDNSTISKALVEFQKKKIPTVALAGAPSYGVIEIADIPVSIPGNIEDDKKGLVVYGVIQLLTDAIKLHFTSEIEKNIDTIARLKSQLNSGI